MSIFARLRRLWCVLRGGHRWLCHLRAPKVYALRCQRCEATAQWDLSTVPPPIPTYAGVPEKHRVGRRWRR